MLIILSLINDIIMKFGRNLTNLDLRNNPITSKSNYKGTLFNFIPSLQVLDNELTSRRQKYRLPIGYTSIFKKKNENVFSTALKNSSQSSSPAVSITGEINNVANSHRISSPIEKEAQTHLAGKPLVGDVSYDKDNFRLLDITNTSRISRVNNKNPTEKLRGIRSSAEKSKPSVSTVSRMSISTGAHVDPLEVKRSLPWHKPPDVVPRPWKGKDPYEYRSLVLHGHDGKSQIRRSERGRGVASTVLMYVCVHHD